MKVLQVNKYNYIRGGAEKYFIEISKALEKNGHQVAIFSMRHPKNLPSSWEKYFVSRISFNERSIRHSLLTPFRILYSLEARRKFKKIIKNFRPDVIHIHNIYHQLSPSILPIAKKYKIPVVMHLHDYKLICPNYQLFVDGKICYRCLGGTYRECLKNKCFANSFWKSFLAMIEMNFHHKFLKIYKKNIDYFIAPSDFMKRVTVAFGWPNDKIKVIHNFSEDLENNFPDIREEYGLYFGRISKEKGLEILLEALSLSRNKINFKIVGSGPEEDNLKEGVNNLKLNNQVEFLGKKFSEDLYSLVRKAKFVVVPSVWAENMPLVLLEAMMLKKVVIVSDTGGLPELVKHKETGFVFKNGDARALAKIIDNIDNYNLTEIGERAGKIAKELSVKNHLSRVIEVYNKVIKR